MIEIKRLRPGDEVLAERAMHEVKRATPDLNHAERYLSNEMNVLLVALDGQQPVGFVLAYELERVDSQPPMMFFYEVEVSESHRRQGIGAALIEALRGICRERRIGKMFVITNRENVAARALYHQTGGREEYDDGVLFVYK